VEMTKFGVFTVMKSITKYIGEKFGKITVLEYLGGKKVRYKCDCGSEKETDFYDIKRGKTTSCGCWRQSLENKKRCREQVKKMREKGIFKTGGIYEIDEITPFRYVWKCINNKSLKGRTRKPVFISIEDLEIIWNRQNGICPYSNFKLILPTHTNIKKHPQYLYASLDRKDSDLPYTLDNCQFISKSLNFAKNNMSEKDFIDFLKMLSVNLRI
jgi:hypothetical protein